MKFLALFFAVIALAAAKPSGWLADTVIVPPSAHAVVSGPAHGWGGWGGWGWGGWGGHGAGVVALSGHGVAVQGPHTVPAVVAGPSGKIVADGLYGVPHHW